MKHYVKAIIVYNLHKLFMNQLGAPSKRVFVSQVFIFNNGKTPVICDFHVENKKKKWFFHLVAN